MAMRKVTRTHLEEEDDDMVREMIIFLACAKWDHVQDQNPISSIHWFCIELK